MKGPEDMILFRTYAEKKYEVCTLYVEKWMKLTDNVCVNTASFDGRRRRLQQLLGRAIVLGICERAIWSLELASSMT